MKHLKNNTFFLGMFALGLLFSSCVQENLDPDNAPEAGEVEDLTPPEAAFSFQQDVVDFSIFLLINESTSSTGQVWTIPDTASLVDESATLFDSNIQVKFPGEGSFEVGLVATDDRPTSSEILLQMIEVIEPDEPVIPTPVIISGSFEEIDVDIYGTSDARNAWGRDNSSSLFDIDGLKVFGTSSGSRVRTGAASAKFEDNDPRQAYQEIAVTPNVDYRISIWIKRGNNVDLVLPDEDEMRLAVLGETFTAFDLSLFEAAIIASNTQNPTEDFARMTLNFNSGDRETVAIYLDSKARVEVQVDDVEIEVL